MSELRREDYVRVIAGPHKGKTGYVNFKRRGYVTIQTAVRRGGGHGYDQIEVRDNQVEKIS